MVLSNYAIMFNTFVRTCKIRDLFYTLKLPLSCARLSGAENLPMPRQFNIQGGSNMTGTDLCVNKPHCAAAVRP